MPDLRALLVAVGVGAGVAAYTLLWWHWSLAVGFGAAILLGGLTLTGTISTGQDAAAADAAWRAAAPDLVDPPAAPRGDQPAAPLDDQPAAPAEGLRGRDIPSGD